MYFVSEDGDVYSTFKNGLLKPSIDSDGYKRVDIHRKHMKVHKLVYITWKGNIPSGMQINHIDDNKQNNHFSNLYAGTQKENISDCIRNNHRVGNRQSILIHEKSTGRYLLFPSIKELISYTGHHISSGSVGKIKNKIWFKERYEIIEQKGVSTIESYIPEKLG